MTLSDERIRALAYTTAFAFLGWTSDRPPQTGAQKGSVEAWTVTIAATVRAAVEEALRIERLAEIEARGDHLARFHPAGERVELSDGQISGMLVSRGYRPSIPIVAAVRDIIAEAAATGRVAACGLQELEDLRSRLDCRHVRLVCTAARGHPAWKAWQVVALHEDGEQFFPTCETASGAIRAAVCA